MLDLWLSDAIGHSGAAPVPATSLQAGREYLQRVDALLTGLLEASAAAVITSDHGNLENLQVKGHTRARVPLAWSDIKPPATPPTDIAAGGHWLAQQLEADTST